MTLTAVFTGAGASKALGYPLTHEFLPRLRSELSSGDLFDDINTKAQDEEDRRDLGRLLDLILPGFKDTPDSELPLITDVFSLVEYGIASGETLIPGGASDLRRLRDLLKQAIADVLIGDLLEEYDESPKARDQQALLEMFASWILKQQPDVGVVTTNYDIALEYELFDQLETERVADWLDLGFDWRDVKTDDERTRPGSPKLRIYKLHGSLDVLRCSLCGYVYFNPDGEIAWQAFRRVIDAENTCVCNTHARLDLHIISPSMVRDIREANLLGVWRSALELLRRADRWVIIGYSLPPEDIAVRSLLLRAYAAREKKPQITVVQLGNEAENTYRLFFPSCHYCNDGLKAFLARESNGAAPPASTQRRKRQKKLK